MMFSQISLAVPDSAAVGRFYCDILGMTDQRDGLGYGGQQAHLKFVQGPAQPPSSDGFYWKIGITLPNLDVAATHLRQSAVSISQPRQFEDIGCMAHCVDPAGATIELLQQGPKGSEPDLEAGHPVANGAILAHVTLRVRDLAAAQNWCAEQGLHLISVQPLDAYGFTLYFYAYNQETPSHGSLTAVANRPWLWRRPYTLLELQHLHGAGSQPGASGPLLALEARDAQSAGSISLPLAGLNV